MWLHFKEIRQTRDTLNLDTKHSKAKTLVKRSNNSRQKYTHYRGNRTTTKQIKLFSVIQIKIKKNGKRRSLRDGGGGRDGKAKEEERRIGERNGGDEERDDSAVEENSGGGRGGGETLLAAGGAGGGVSRSGA